MDISVSDQPSEERIPTQPGYNNQGYMIDPNSPPKQYPPPSSRPSSQAPSQNPSLGYSSGHSNEGYVTEPGQGYNPPGVGYAQPHIPGYGAAPPPGQYYPSSSAAPPYQGYGYPSSGSQPGSTINVQVDYLI